MVVRRRCRGRRSGRLGSWGGRCRSRGGRGTGSARGGAGNRAANAHSDTGGAAQDSEPHKNLGELTLHKPSSLSRYREALIKTLETKGRLGAPCDFGLLSRPGSERRHSLLVGRSETRALRKAGL